MLRGVLSATVERLPLSGAMSPVTATDLEGEHR